MQMARNPQFIRRQAKSFELYCQQGFILSSRRINLAFGEYSIHSRI